MDIKDFLSSTLNQGVANYKKINANKLNSSPTEPSAIFQRWGRSPTGLFPALIKDSDMADKAALLLKEPAEVSTDDVRDILQHLCTHDADYLDDIGLLDCVGCDYGRKDPTTGLTIKEWLARAQEYIDQTPPVIEM